MDARQESHRTHLELEDLYSIDWNGAHTDEENSAVIDDVFFECIVCQYWSERIDDAWRQRENALTKARLERLLKEHQTRGACARRSPTILTDLKHAQTSAHQ